MLKTITTLVLLLKDDKIMLAEKKRGFGAGKYNGVGGKLEPGETVIEAMLRETKEEVGVTPTKYEKVGEMEFNEFYKGQPENLIFHLFLCTEWDGELVETDEMIPHWFPLDNIPYDNMFNDDKYWLPRILNGEKLKGYFDFDEEWNLLSHRFEDYIEE